MTQKTNADLVAKAITEELHGDAVHLGKQLQSEFGTLGAQKMGKDALLEMAARHWGDPTPAWGPLKQPLWAYLYRSMGPTNLTALYREGVARGLLPPGFDVVAAPGDLPAPTQVPTSASVTVTPPKLGQPVGAMTEAAG